MYRVNRIVVAIISSVATIVAGGTHAAAAPREPDKFIAHEWGTLSTFSSASADGACSCPAAPMSNLASST